MHVTNKMCQIELGNVPPANIIIKMDIFIYLLKGAIGRQWGEIFYLLVHSPNGCNTQNWAKLKPGASHLCLPHVWQGPNHLGIFH